MPLFATPALLIFPFVIRKWKPIKRRDLLLAILCGLVLYFGTNLLVYLGLQRTSSISAAVIFMLEPILLFVFSVELMREKFKKKVFFGIIIAFLGTALIVLGPTIGAPTLSAGSLTGNLLLLSAASFSVVGVWFTKYLTKRIPTFQLLFIGLASASVGYLILALPTITDMSGFKNSVVIFGALYGVVAVGLTAYALRFWSLKTIAGQDYGLISYIEPVVTALVAFLFFKEVLTDLTLIGVAIVFIGVWLAEVRVHSHWHFRSK